MNRRGLFLFHRDFRIQDNIGFLDACSNSDRLYTTFIFTPEQVNKNRYKSDNAVQFMIESLADLSEQLNEKGGELLTLYGDMSKMVEYLIKNLGIQALYFNCDYTPYARKRDAELENLCAKLGIQCKMYHDYYLQVPGSMRNQSGGYYHKFTPFYEAMLKQPVLLPKKGGQIKCLAKSSNHLGHRMKLADADRLFVKHLSSKIYLFGGRKNGIKCLKTALTEQADYGETRDLFARETSHLSAYLKFGCISVREVFQAFRKKYGIRHDLLRQLIWRDFHAHLLYAYPESMRSMYYINYEKISWKTNDRWLQSWKQGATGFPLVDAAMRELNATGYMHNRGRMLVASILIKTLLLDWREGERYFAQKLVDYDVASNLGNWQSIVGGGAYNSAWFRTMSPYVQSSKFDPDAVYIKKWVPELRDIPAKDIHRWDQACEKYKKTVDYPCPMVNFHEQTAKMLDMYRRYI